MVLNWCHMLWQNKMKLFVKYWKVGKIEFLEYITCGWEFIPNMKNIRKIHVQQLSSIENSTVVFFNRTRYWLVLWLMYFAAGGAVISDDAPFRFYVIEWIFCLYILFVILLTSILTVKEYKILVVYDWTFLGAPLRLIITYIKESHFH